MPVTFRLPHPRSVPISFSLQKYPPPQKKKISVRRDPDSTSEHSPTTPTNRVFCHGIMDTEQRTCIGFLRGRCVNIPVFHLPTPSLPFPLFCALISDSTSTGYLYRCSSYTHHHPAWHALPALRAVRTASLFATSPRAMPGRNSADPLP
jgi:hypothetical protein